MELQPVIINPWIISFQSPRSLTCIVNPKAPSVGCVCVLSQVEFPLTNGELELKDFPYF